LHHIETLLLHKELKEGGLRLTLTDGVAKRGVIVKEKGPTNFLLSAFDAMAEIESLSATIVSIRRNEQSPLSQIKSISYLDNVLAKQEALSNGFDEAILLNSQGFISDGATTNVYALKENTLFTPPVSDGALPGVMRARLLDKGFEGHQIKVSSLDKAFLLNAEKIYLSNALIGMKPLHQFEHKTFTK
jgi:branched-chain amino acid aminotransferase